MISKYVLPAIVLAATGVVSAEEYQSITNFGTQHTRLSATSENSWHLNSIYYFEKKQSLGPLDQFEYINKVSNVWAGVSRSYNQNYWSLVGSYVAENNLVLHGGHSRVSDIYQNMAGIGYLISDDLIIEARAFKPKDGNTSYTFSAAYNHQLQGRDYIGFFVYTDEKADNYGISSKYFASLNGGQFLVATLSVNEMNGNSSWRTGVDYYFNSMTSVGLSYSKSNQYSLDAKHFFSKNWALAVSFESNTKHSSIKYYQVGVVGQF